MFVLFFAALVLAVLAWLWGPPLWASARRRRVAARPFPHAWRAILQRRMPYYRRLPPDLQLQLRKQVQVLLAEVPMIGCNGLVVTDEVRVLIAAQAALLLLNRGVGGFRNLRQVLVYPDAFVVERPLAAAGGVVHDARRVLVGESWQQGQLILAWDEVVAGAADPDDGRNVVIHEFAHQLDQERGPANGAPFLGRRERYARWSRIWNAEFERARAARERGEPTPIDAYGTSEPAEFFAIASELFFERPAALAGTHRGLFQELVEYYRVDPLEWQAG